MEASVIRARLGLLIRLIDTTTGAAVEESDVRFFVNGQRARPASRGAGSFVFINTERENILLSVQAFGYEEAETYVDFEKLDDRIPVCDIFLIPSEKYAKGEPVIGIFGNLPFLEAVECVDLNRPVCRISDYSEKTRKMSVIRQPGRILDLSYGYYGLLQPDGKSYEKVIVSGTEKEQYAVLKEPLQQKAAVNSPLFRIIFGKADSRGNYILRVRDDSDRLEMLVCCRVKGEDRNQIVDFHDPAVLELGQTAERQAAEGQDGKD